MAFLDGDGRGVNWRSLDWELPELGQLTVELHFKRGGTTVFKSVGWVGLVGVFTGLTRTYSIALNYRRTDAGSGGVVGAALRLLRGYVPASYVIRRTLEADMVRTSAAVRVLRQMHLVAPAYLTVCGVDVVATVLVRNPSGVVAARYPHTGPDDDDFLVQTNHDAAGTEATADVLGSYARTATATNICRRNVVAWKQRPRDCLLALAVAPVVNEHTVYYCLMQPGPEMQLKVLRCNA